MKPLNIIVALDEGGGFSKNGTIPWLNEPWSKIDLKHFKQVTSGGICIMGRKTYQDMFEIIKSRSKSNKPIKDILPNRTSYVITSSTKKMPGVTKRKRIREVVEGLDENNTREIFILGGYRMFLEALPWTTKIYITLVPGYYDCDIKFPLQALKKFKIVDGLTEDRLHFIEYRRISE